MSVPARIPSPAVRPLPPTSIAVDQPEQELRDALAMFDTLQCLTSSIPAADLTRGRRHRSAELASPVMSLSVHRKAGRGGKGEVIHELRCQTRAVGPGGPTVPR